MSSNDSVRAWREDLVIPTYLPEAPDKNPIFSTAMIVPAKTDSFAPPVGLCAGIIVCLSLSASAALAGEILDVTVNTPSPPITHGFHLGASRRPDGATLTVDSDSLLLDGQQWMPVMGEFHFSRYPENEWREELLKMKAGGVDIVSTYVFWIHHEEIEGQFDWSGRRNLHHFLQLCQEAGLKAIVRCGPWDHGEVRNGGFPDWLLAKGWKTRSNDSNYLATVRIFYGEIAKQLTGLLWKDGGPVIGMQLENEFRGPAEHLLTLKQLARDAGIDVPLYTRTGWPAPQTPMPFGEIIPLYGSYAEGFWDRQLTSMPGTYWTGFQFSTLRADTAIATDIFGKRAAQDSPGAGKYPYLTCELGGGMMSSYHRRILIDPADVDALALVKIGSGSASPGYYMYHGGVNPDGKLSTLMESQATGYWNDMPVKNYDFQAPLGEYGEIRPQYHWLRRMHLLLHDWGPALADMPATMPDKRPGGEDDLSTLRWCVRSDGRGGFVFVNNYQRSRPLPPKSDVQFAIHLPHSSLTFPDTPVTVVPGSRFIWPFHLALGHGVNLLWASAQPICYIDEGRTRTVFFAETEGVPARFAFNAQARVKASGGQIAKKDDCVIVHNIVSGVGPAVEIRGEGGRVRVVLLSQAQSLALWKGIWQGRERVFLTPAGLVLDGAKLRLTSTNRANLSLDLYPAPKHLVVGGKKIAGKTDGVFARFSPPPPPLLVFAATAEELQPAGPPREIPMGKIRGAVAAAPEDSDFEKAAIWRIKLPADLDLNSNPMLKFRYVGDVARVTLDGKVLTDDFYNGNAFDVGLWRDAPGILHGDLRVAILPLRKDAPIFMAPAARPDFGGSKAALSLDKVEIVPQYQIELEH